MLDIFSLALAKGVVKRAEDILNPRSRGRRLFFAAALHR